jgi:hypothetical protein
MTDPADRFVVARNPDPESTLRFLLRVPLDGGIPVEARDRWPTTSRVYCHPLDEWPVDTARGQAIASDRQRERR